MRRVMAAAISILLSAIGITLVSATPASACSCGDNAFEFFDEAEVELAFIGTVTDEASLFARSDKIWTFETTEVLVGEAGPTVLVRAPSLSASCALGAQVGDTLAVIAFDQGGVWNTISCDTGSPAQAAGFGDPQPPNASIGPGRSYANREVAFFGGGLAVIGSVIGVKIRSRSRKRSRQALKN